MARIRSIKPEAFKNEQLAECEAFARLLFFGLFGLADSKGRLHDKPKRIKLECLPYDNLDVDSLLQQLHDNELIERYEIEGEKFIWIIKFLKHQRLSGNEVKYKSQIPPSPNDRGQHEKQSGSTDEKQSASSGSDDSHQDAAQLPRKGNKERNKEKEKEGSAEGRVPPVGVFEFLAPRFRTPELEKAWADWLEYRRQKRSAAYVEASLKDLAKAFDAGFPDSNSLVSSIRKSIQAGYSQIFPPKPSEDPKTFLVDLYPGRKGPMETFAVPRNATPEEIEQLRQEEIRKRSQDGAA